MADKPALADIMQEHAHLIMSSVPWAKELGFEVTSVEKSRAFAKVPWQEHLVGTPQTGVIAGGVITSLLDNLCGVAVASALEEFKFVATLDLRIDYMRPATKGEDVLAEAECYHVTRSVAFCHAWAYHDDRSRMVATASAAFALTDRSRKPRPPKTGTADRAGETS